MTVAPHDITRLLLADGWHVPEPETVEWELCHLDAASESLVVMTWIEVRGNASNPEDRHQIVAPFSEVLAFEVR